MGTPDEVYEFEEGDDGALVLCDARLVGVAKAPVWRFPSGVERRWARLEPAGTPDALWARHFQSCKEVRLRLKHQLSTAISDGDLDRVASFKTSWDGEGGIPSDLTPEHRSRLAVGRFMVPGACFLHRRFGYRGVILACEAWCNAPASWRAQMGVPLLSGGDTQPFYHCLVDARDRPGMPVTFVGEENIELSDSALPVASPLVDLLLVRCDALAGYLPSPALEEALRRQSADGSFTL